jgi:hypothetical protein
MESKMSNGSTESDLSDLCSYNFENVEDMILAAEAKKGSKIEGSEIKASASPVQLHPKRIRQAPVRQG